MAAASSSSNGSGGSNTTQQVIQAAEKITVFGAGVLFALKGQLDVGLLLMGSAGLGFTATALSK